MSDLAVIVHGGAAAVRDEQMARIKRPVLKEAVDAAWQSLLRGEPGERAVVEALAVFEADEYFNAGFGAHLNADGQVFLDVGLMRGCGDFISLMNVPRIKFPSRLALDRFQNGQKLMLSWTERLAGEVDKLPKELLERYGVLAKNEDLAAPHARELFTKYKAGPKSGTVGCVVRDAKGELFAGTSTGGIQGKVHGRIGDSPIVGAGVFADSRVGAHSCTGDGEAILGALLGGHIISLMRRETEKNPDYFVVNKNALHELLQDELDRMKQRYPRSGAGVIAIPPKGKPAYAFCSEGMTIAGRMGSRDNIEWEEVTLALR